MAQKYAAKITLPYLNLINVKQSYSRTYKNKDNSYERNINNRPYVENINNSPEICNNNYIVKF